MYTDKENKQVISRIIEKPKGITIQQLQKENRINTFMKRTGGLTNGKNCQLKAFIGTRTLGFSGSSKSESSGSSGAGQEGNVPNVEKRGLQIFNPERGGNKSLIHAHILFENPHPLRVVGEKNNIGYGQEGLFSENYPYKTIGHEMENENKVVEIIKETDFDVEGNSYSVMNHNCQNFVNDVYGKYNSN